MRVEHAPGILFLLLTRVCVEFTSDGTHGQSAHRVSMRVAVLSAPNPTSCHFPPAYISHFIHKLQAPLHCLVLPVLLGVIAPEGASPRCGSRGRCQR